MQGLYKLALVGTKQQLTDFLKKVNDNDPDSVFNEYAVEEGTGLRTTQGYGRKNFWITINLSLKTPVPETSAACMKWSQKSEKLLLN